MARKRNQLLVCTISELKLNTSKGKVGPLGRGEIELNIVRERWEDVAEVHPMSEDGRAAYLRWLRKERPKDYATYRKQRPERFPASSENAAGSSPRVGKNRQRANG